MTKLDAPITIHGQILRLAQQLSGAADELILTDASKARLYHDYAATLCMIAGDIISGLSKAEEHGKS
jgi:hypothetical protein